MTKTGNTSCDNKDIRDTGCEPEYKNSLRVKLVSKEPDKNDTQQANRQDTHSLLFSSPYSVLAATTQFGTAPHEKCRRFYHGEKKKTSHSLCGQKGKNSREAFDATVPSVGKSATLQHNYSQTSGIQNKPLTLTTTQE